jgi:YHS domain-containing protein
MRFAIVVIVALCVLPSALCAAPPEPKLALKGLDPIALSEGKEVEGSEALETLHGQFRYRFATKENKAAFEAKPEERGIQFGGACGKMGPFSGSGSPQRFFVHEGRIYVFASEGCRDAFKRDPEKHIERPNPVPDGSEEQRKRGAELLALALKGFGGAERVDRLKSLQEFTRHVYKQGDNETVSSHQVAWAFPDRVRIVEEFSVPYGYVVDGRKGHQIEGKNCLMMENGIREIAWRQALRQPLAMLKNRHAKGFTAIAKGAAKVDKTDVELLAVALDGATSTWLVDPATGRILEVQFEARRGTVGHNVIQFSDFREIDGLIIPHRRTRFFNGKEVDSPQTRIERIAPDGILAPELFLPST